MATGFAENKDDAGNYSVTYFPFIYFELRESFK